MVGKLWEKIKMVVHSILVYDTETVSNAINLKIIETIQTEI